MGRKNKNITIQLNRRIDELLRIGEKKVKVDGRVATINSVQTADSYRGTANRIGEVCKSMGVRNIEDIDKSVIERYMDSSHTPIHLDFLLPDTQQLVNTPIKLYSYVFIVSAHAHHPLENFV